MALSVLEVRARVQFPGSGGLVFKAKDGFTLTAQGPWVHIAKDGTDRMTPLANVVFAEPA